MSRQQLHLAPTRALARALLRIYPRAFRQRHGRDFVEIAAHRWQREFDTTGGQNRATVRTGLILCADTLGSAAGSWRSTGPALDPHRGAPESRKDRLMSWITGSVSDLRMAARMLRRQPATAALAVATLALGIGASTAAFGALDRVVLRPLAFEHGQQMRYLALEHRTMGWQLAPEAEMVERWRQGSKTVSAIESYRDANAVRLDAGPAGILTVTRISLGLPEMLGARPLLGRMLTPGDADPGAPTVVMVTERFWRSALGGDPEVVGQALSLTSGPVTIVGVWPSEARFTYRTTPDLIRIVPRDEEFSSGGWISVLGLLRPGVEDADVTSELEALNAGLPGERPDLGIAVIAPTGFVAPGYVQGIKLVFVGAIVLLVVALINAANLLLGRATTREAELGVRLALGGSRARIVRLFLAESLVLTSAGVTAGFGVATLAGQAYSAWDPLELMADRGAWLNDRTLLFGAAAAAGAALVGALLPAWRARATGLSGVISSAAGSRTTDASSRLRGVLIGAQAALAVLLVGGAALTARSFDKLAHIDPGFDVDRLAMVSVSAPSSRYPELADRQAFIEQVRQRIESLPMVERVTTTNAPPFRTTSASGIPTFDGESSPPDKASSEMASQRVDENYFAVFGTRLVAGRLFEPGEPANSIIINESFARRHGGAAVLGRQLRFNDRPDATRYLVVGVVEDVSANALTMDPTSRPQLYMSSPNPARGFERFIIRVDGDADAVIPEVRARVAAMDPTIPLAEATTVAELFANETARHRFVAYLLAGLALFGLAFAVSGVYGVVSLDVARRTREVGLRVALGATASQVVRNLIGRGLRPVVAGTAIGVACALWAAPALESLLFDVQARDPLSVGAGVLCVLMAATGACVLPARRAARVDPAVTLRTE